MRAHYILLVTSVSLFVSVASRRILGEVFPSRLFAADMITRKARPGAAVLFAALFVLLISTGTNELTANGINKVTRGVVPE